MTTHRGGRALVLALAVLLVCAQVVAAVGVTTLSPSPVAGADYGVRNDTRLVYDGWDLLFDGSGDVVGVGVDLNNTEGVDKTGRITVRLERKDGTVVASNSTTFFVQKNRAGRCSVSLPSPEPPGGFSFVVLSVDVTATATQDCEIMGGGGGSNSPPSAKTETSQNSTRVVSKVTFDGTKSKDNDGSIVAFDWLIEVENGSTVSRSGAIVNETYTQVGCYNATLTVTDDDGATDTANTTVAVSPSSGQKTKC